MSHFSKPAFLLAGVLLTLQSASFASVDGENTASDKKLPHAVAALTAAGDADSLGAAAQLTAFDKDGKAQQLVLLRRAVALAPDRPDLLWKEVMVCTHGAECDATVYADALHKLDPGNGAAWLPWIDRATKLNDAEALRTYLAAIAKTDRFDIYWNKSIAHATNALIKVNVYGVAEALVRIYGIEAATSLPAFKNVVSACRPDALQDPERLATCRAIAKALRGSDTYLAELLGPPWRCEYGPLAALNTRMRSARGDWRTFALKRRVGLNRHTW